jgi:hypothetical protein
MANFQTDKSYGAGIDSKGIGESGKYALSDSSSDQNSISEGKTFLTAGLKDAYVPIDKYEGKHRWDVNFQWTPEEEKAVVRKVQCSGSSCTLYHY